MAVPDTNTFGLTDVIAEISPPTSGLVSCLATALDRKFDLNYGGKAAQSLYCFRNYGNYRTIQLSASGGASASVGCGYTAGTNYYTDFSVLPTIGVIIYTNYLTNTVLNGGNNWYKYLSAAIQINASGEIIDISDCYTSIVLGVGQTTTSAACGTSPSVGYYIPLGASVNVGTYVYTDSALTSVLVGGDKYYKYGSNEIIRVQNSGYISAKASCSTALLVSTAAYTTAALACADPMTTTTTVYYGAGGYFDGETLYTDAALTTTYNGGNRYHKNGAGNRFIVSTAGVVSATGFCF